MANIRADAPADVQFLFSHSQKSVSRAFGVSFAVHGALVALALFLATRPSVQSTARSLLPDSLSSNLVWLPVPGAGGGGGGGGNGSKEPARRVQRGGSDQTTVPVTKTPASDASPDTPEPLQSLVIPAVLAASDNLTLPGVLDAPPSASQLQGPGTKGGAGGGDGPGMGPGSGPGLGPGFDGGAGGNVYRLGDGVEPPRVLQQVKPVYTAQAMRAKIQGAVLLECVVLPNGTAGPIKVLRSLDPVFGLDEEAIKAARQWRFAPGTRLGKPVSVLVTIEITFTLR